MLWVPLVRRVRHLFLLPQITALILPTDTEREGILRAYTPIHLQGPGFDFAPLVARAVAAESAFQEDHEDDDASNAEEDTLDAELPLDPPLDPLDGVDDAWPPPSAPDPWDDVDDTNPSPRPRKRRRSTPSFPEVVASAEPPHAGPHRQRPAKPHRLAQKDAAATARRKAKRLKKKQVLGHVPATSTIHEHVKPAVPLKTHFDSSSLPSALGAYAARVKDTDKKYSSKVRRSLANLLGLGFGLVKWDGFTPRPLVDNQGRIIAVLAGQPRHDAYREAVERAFRAIRDAGYMDGGKWGVRSGEE
ncbi:hypothetical protein DFH09DRAFT_1102476 [Mycena vulgaris]|nr:hypothetical protein DFH09DRAFT_1102476 [Mycena vulgaris]